VKELNTDKLVGPILILSAKLGTQSGVGGRRWALFGRRMMEQGLEVHIITAQKELPQEFKGFSNRVHRIESVYPDVLQFGPRNIWGKIQYRLALLYMKFRVRGTVYDTGALDVQNLRRLARNIIRQHNIKTVICTGAPFSYLYTGVLLKQEFPHLLLLSDFRDRWTNGFHYGIRALHAKRFAAEADREAAVLRSSDVITAACPDIIAYLSERVPANYHLLLNPVSDLLQPLPQVPDSLAPKVFTITCAGNIGKGCEPYFEHFLSNVAQLQQRLPGQFRFVFIGNGDREMDMLLDQNPMPCIQKHPYMNQQSLSEFLSVSNAFLLFQRPEMVNSIATKVFDYMKFRKPIIACVGPGGLYDLITENNLGYIMDRNLSAEDFIRDMSRLRDGSLPFNRHFDYTPFTLDAQVQKILHVLEEARKKRN
jgi:hypothetical protein